jgi:hypothetical protein
MASNPGSAVTRLAAAALMLLVALSLGCGKSDKAHDIVAKSKTDVIGDRDFGLPDKFPKDVPILKNATVKAALSQGDRMIVHLYTTSSIKDAATFYNAALKSQGWTIESTSSGADMAIVSAKKGTTRCGVTIAKEGKGTLVRLAISSAHS